MTCLDAAQDPSSLLWLEQLEQQFFSLIHFEKFLKVDNVLLVWKDKTYTKDNLMCFNCALHTAPELNQPHLCCLRCIKWQKWCNKDLLIHSQATDDVVWHWNILPKYNKHLSLEWQISQIRANCSDNVSFIVISDFSVFKCETKSKLKQRRGAADRDLTDLEHVWLQPGYFLPSPPRRTARCVGGADPSVGVMGTLVRPSSGWAPDSIKQRSC